MISINAIGWIGSFFLVICTIPQVYETYKTKNVVGLSFMMLITLMIGCSFSLVYGIAVHAPIQMLLSYIVNNICGVLLIVAYAMYRKK